MVLKNSKYMVPLNLIDMLSAATYREHTDTGLYALVCAIS